MTITTEETELGNKVLVETKKEENQGLAMSQHLQSMRTCAAVLGFIVGALIQGSNLGGNFVIVTTWASMFNGIGQDDHYLEDASTVVVTFLCAWSAMTAVMGIAILFFLRIIVASTFIGLDHCKAPQESMQLPVQILSTIDRFFFIGGVVGTAMWWCLTYQIIGWIYVVYQNVCIVIAALVFYATTAISTPEGQDWMKLGVQQEADSCEECHNGYFKLLSDDME